MGDLIFKLTNKDLIESEHLEISDAHLEDDCWFVFQVKIFSSPKSRMCQMKFIDILKKNFLSSGLELFSCFNVEDYRPTRDKVLIRNIDTITLEYAIKVEYIEPIEVFVKNLTSI